MEFNKAYSRDEFLSFLRVNFLPEDFNQEISTVENPVQFQYTQQVTRLGECESLGLVVYEVRHSSKHDARVGLTKEAFRLLADEFCERALVFFVPEDDNSNYRFSLIEITLDQSESSSRVSRRYSNPHRYSYYLGEGIPTHTPKKYLKSRVVDIVDLRKRFSVEVLSDEFFEEFDKLYSCEPYPNCEPGFIEEFEANPEMLEPFLDKSQEDVEKQKKPMRDYVKKLMGRLVFMQFLQKKGWLGVPADTNDWNGGNEHFLQDIFKASSCRDTFLDDVLEPLFFEYLNTPEELRKKRYLTIDGKDYKVPYLNGGLFEQTDLDRKPSRFSSGLFQRLFDLFDLYNFTVDENDPDDVQVGVDPEMLGRIFENQLEDNNDKGAFYTPKPIVQYMCRESLIAYLQTNVEDEFNRECIRAFVDTHDKEYLSVYQQKDVLAKLKSVSICDPAIGSGAFPVGLLKELFYCRQELEPIASAADTKKQIIQENIYGVDIEQGAVDIARLRFWLSIVVDCERPEPLPNLDYKIVTGNSLLTTFNNAYIDLRLKTVINGRYVTRSSVPAIRMSKKALLAEQRRFYNLNGEEKYRSSIAIKKHILDIIWFQLDYERNARKEDNRQVLDVFGVKKVEQIPEFSEERQTLFNYCEFLQRELEDDSKSLKERSEISLPFFDWEIIFSDIFDQPEDEKGFDIVIGNPPYFVYEGNNKDELPNLRKQDEFKIAFGGKLNAYKLFLACSLKKLIKKDGINCFIFQNSFLADQQATNLRNYVLNNCQILIIDSYPERDSRKKRVFESVKMSVCILLAQNSTPRTRFLVNVWDDKYKSSGLSTYFTKEEIANIDPESLTIPRLREEAKPVIYKMIAKRAKVIKCWEGELNITSHKSFFSDDSNLPVIMKGAGIQRYYYTFDMSQGQIEYLKEKEYMARCGNAEKAHHHEKERIIMQDMTGANDKIRLIATIAPRGMYLGHSCKYVLPSDDISQKCLLGFLNSKLANFFFRCFSTNSHVNSYEIEAIPICNMPQSISERIEKKVETILSQKTIDYTANTCSLENEIDLIVYHLYNLTYDEVLIVDPETPITREEYDSFFN